jgi:plasmid stability protein
MTLRKLANDMRRALTEAAPEFRSNRAEVEKLIDAMLSGPQVPTKAQAVIGKDGNMAGLLGELRLALYPVVVHTLQKIGGKVSGSSNVQAALRGMAREERENPPQPSIEL